jgi:CDP-diacylglycerol--serine O-phosphatidyltransferase
MVSTIKYSSFKKPELFRKMNFNVLVAVGLILIFTAAQPSSVLFILGLIYVILGAFITLQNHRRIKQKTLGTVELEKHTSSSI